MSEGIGTMTSTEISAVPTGDPRAEKDASPLYKAKYGAWAGDRRGAAPDHTRCCEAVWTRGGWAREHQCTKPRGHGPDGAYCKQHDPEVVKARDAANTAKANAKWNKQRYEWSGPKFFAALQKIAEGHNDARGLAQEVIDEFKSGEH